MLPWVRHGFSRGLMRVALLSTALTGSAFAQPAPTVAPRLTPARLTPARLTGRVVDDSGAPIANARVLVTSQDAPTRQQAIETHTNPTGAFDLPIPREGAYLVSVEHEGYFLVKDRSVQVDKEVTEITLVLNPEREVFQSVEVGDAPSSVDTTQTTREERLSGTEVNDIPYPASHSLRNSLKLMPGVVQDPSGAVHFQGGAENQTDYTLDGFDVASPISGRFNTLLAVEGIRALDYSSGRESAELGRGSAGTLAIHPENGTDQFHFTATNFFPGFDTKGGLHLGDWTPRGGLSGPLWKGRAWFSDSFNGEYNETYVSGLPKGQDFRSNLASGNLFHAQVNLTPANILYGDVVTNFQREGHAGLGPLDPVETTTNRHSSEILGAIKDSHTWYNGALLEGGLSAQRFTFSTTPLGDQPYLITPEGTQGNYYVRSHQQGHRQQLFSNFFPPAFRFGGRHQFQIGGDAQRLGYDGQFQRTSFEVVGLSGLPLYGTSFDGSGNFQRPNTAIAGYVNDHYEPWKRLAIDVGVREDYDHLIHRAALAPRVSLSYAPFANGRTKVTAGYGVIHDTTNLYLFSRPLDQIAVTTTFSDLGIPELSLPTTFDIPRHLLMPRFTNWSAGAEHDFGHRLSAKLELLDKHGGDGFVYEQPGSPALFQPRVFPYGIGGQYGLSNFRRDSYKEASVTVRKSFSDQYEIFGSYVRSSATSNAILDGAIDLPLETTGNLVRVPWDTPNRILSWAYLPMYFKNWAFAYLLDWRTGFPYSVGTERGIITGPVDSYAFPSNFDLNLHVERRFVLRGYRFAIRAGCNNVTDHRNPTSVNNTIGSPQFLQLFGDEGRHFEFRLRFFGKKGA